MLNFDDAFHRPGLPLIQMSSDVARQMALFEFSEEDFADDGDDSDIRDGPGPGVQELDLGFDGGPGMLDFGR